MDSIGAFGRPLEDGPARDKGRGLRLTTRTRKQTIRESAGPREGHHSCPHGRGSTGSPLASSPVCALASWSVCSSGPAATRHRGRLFAYRCLLSASNT